MKLNSKNKKALLISKGYNPEDFCDCEVEEVDDST